IGWVSPLAVWNAAKIAEVWVRLGRTKRSPSEKSSNQRCSLTMRWFLGSKSDMAIVPACDVSSVQQRRASGNVARDDCALKPSRRSGQVDSRVSNSYPD